MRSGTPKVLHPLCGRPMVLHVVDALAELPLERIVVVVGLRRRARHQDAARPARHRGARRVRRAAGAARHRRRGERRAHGLRRPRRRRRHPRAPGRRAARARRDDRQARDRAPRAGRGRPRSSPQSSPSRSGSGRVVRDKDGRVARVVEHADATAEEREIDEINTSIYCFRRSLLAPALRRLSPENAQGEYYLTDAIAVLRDAGHKVIALQADDPRRSDHGQRPRRSSPTPKPSCARASTGRGCARASRWSTRRRRTSTRWSSSRSDVRLLPGTILEGRTVIGAGSVIGPDVPPDRRRRRRARAHVERGRGANARSATTARSGRTRTCGRARGSAAGVKVGTYVEVKNSEIGEGTKVPHLSYVGDADIGAGANLGASTITANYDGENKHRTKIGDGVHTGVHTSLVAPVELGDGAETGAGSVVTNDVAAGPAREGHSRTRRPRRSREDEADGDARLGIAEESSPNEEADPRRRARPPGAVDRGRRVPEGAARRLRAVDVRERRDLLPVRREHPRRRRLRVPDARRRFDQRLADGAADHDRRRQARVGEAHHRGVPVLRIRAPGPEGRGPRADHGAARRRHAHRRGRRPRRHRRPAHRPDPGLLRLSRSTTSPRCR